MVAAIVALAIAGLTAAAFATAFGVRKGQLEGDKAVLYLELSVERKEHATTRIELVDEMERSDNQLEHLRNELTDMEDMLATCTDPVVIGNAFDELLQKAQNRHRS